MTAGGEPFPAERGQHAGFHRQGAGDLDGPHRLAQFGRPGQSYAGQGADRILGQLAGPLAAAAERNLASQRLEDHGESTADARVTGRYLPVRGLCH